MVGAQRVLIRLTPIGVHLFRFRFRTGLICRGASPPPSTRRASLLSGLWYAVVVRRAIVHVQVHAANVPCKCRHARGVDEWTTASDDDRVRRRTAALGAPQNVRTARTHTQGMGSGVPCLYSGPGASCRACKRPSRADFTRAQRVATGVQRVPLPRKHFRNFSGKGAPAVPGN
jgi:hypothetical protein